jgi:hypothetical protein
MTFALILFGGAAVLELLVHIFGKIRRLRRFFAVLAICSGGFVAGMLFALRPNILTGLILLVGLYRLFNMVRVIHERMHEQYLRRATRTTTLSLFGIQGVIFIAWWVWEMWHTDDFASWGVVAGLQLVAAVILLMSMSR